MRVRFNVTGIFLAAVASAAVASVVIWPEESPESKIEFREDENGLTASLLLRVNNSPAIIDTSFVVDKEKMSITLAFVVIQNKNLYRRSIRQVALAWQLGKINQKDYSFKIKGSLVALNTEKIKTLLPKQDG